VRYKLFYYSDNCGCDILFFTLHPLYMKTTINNLGGFWMEFNKSSIMRLPDLRLSIALIVVLITLYVQDQQKYLNDLLNTI
jgi:hypothetical protein